MRERIQFEQWVSTHIERVFPFFASPMNLPRIMPPESGTRLLELKLVPPAASNMEGIPLTALAGAGSEIVTSIRVLPFLPFRAVWIALITEFDWNRHFADAHTRGPFRHFHHRHEFAAETRVGVNGTIIRDAIEYEVGFSFFGILAQKLLVARQLRRTFAYRQLAVAKLLGNLPGR